MKTLINVPNINEEMKSPLMEKDEEVNSYDTCNTRLRHVVWLIFGGGLIMLILWYLFAVFATILLIPSPYSVKVFKLLPILLTPSTRYTDIKTVTVSPNFCLKICHFFWIFPFGIILWIIHLTLGIVFAPFWCFGIKFTRYHFNCLGVAMDPNRQVIINKNIHKFNYYTNSYDIVKNIKHLSNKVCIITGCNTGIGKETAKQLYASGCIVVMACRNQIKADNARNDIIKQFKNINEQNIFNIQLDLADLKTIDQFVDTFIQNDFVNGRLDYLINNAGVMAFPKFVTTSDGLERQFGINHMGHFYLVNKLLPILKQNKTRIITVSSCGHYLFNDANDMQIWLNNNNKLQLQGPTPDIIKYNKGGFKYYGMSKLCNLLFTRQLNRLYNNDGIIALSLHPGSIAQTNLSRNIRVDCSMLFSIWNFSAIHEGCKPKTIPQGAATTLRCVIISNKEIFGGNDFNNIENMAIYFDDCIVRNDKIHKEFINGQNTQIDEALWDYSCKIIKSLDYLQLNE